MKNTSNRRCYRLVDGKKVYFPCPEPGKKPSIQAMARNFANAVKDEAISVVQGVPDLSPDEIERRIEVCKGCEHLLAESMRCARCGCFVQVKAAWRSQSCPVGKW